jgi:hypothetical protein
MTTLKAGGSAAVAGVRGTRKRATPTWPEDIDQFCKDGRRIFEAAEQLEHLLGEFLIEHQPIQPSYALALAGLHGRRPSGPRHDVAESVFQAVLASVSLMQALTADLRGCGCDGGYVRHWRAEDDADDAE